MLLYSKPIFYSNRIVTKRRLSILLCPYHGKIDVLSGGPSSADEGPSLETSIFPLSFQVVREPLPFAYH